jgi:hypothetical protein
VKSTKKVLFFLVKSCFFPWSFSPELVMNLKVLLEVEVSLGCSATRILIELLVRATSSLVSSHIVWSWSCVCVGRLMCVEAVAAPLQLQGDSKHGEPSSLDARRLMGRVSGPTPTRSPGQWPRSLLLLYSSFLVLSSDLRLEFIPMNFCPRWN